MIPTCDNAQATWLKTFIHGATAVLYLAMLVYHLRSAAYHVRG